MPLGNMLWEETSKAVGRRIKDVSERGISEEVSFAGSIKGHGRLEGMEARVVGTDDYWEKLTEGVITGTAAGVLTFSDGEIVGFKSVGIGKAIRHSPVGIESLLSLIWFPDPPPNLSWMRTTLVLWEAMTDPKTQTVTATAYEWEGAEEATRSARA